MGEFYALACAFTWSLSLIMVRKITTESHPICINFFKNALASLLMFPTIFFAYGSLDLNITASDLGLLVISGVLGIGIADFLLFLSLSKIGASALAIVETAYSPTIFILSVLFLGERLGSWQIVGAIMIGCALFVIHKPRGLEVPVASGGVLIGLLAMVLMGVGIVIVKPLFDQVPLLWVIQIRLLAGVLGSGGLLVFIQNPGRQLFEMATSSGWKVVWAAAFLSAYVSMMFWLAGFKYAQTTVAAILNQTSTFFTVIMAAVFLNEKVSKRLMVACLLAFSGVVIIML